MKSLIQAVAFAVVVGVPVASFAQSATQPLSQETQATHTQAAGQQNGTRTDSSGYGSGIHGAWQTGRSTDTVVSSYSPPVYNVRRAPKR